MTEATLMLAAGCVLQIAQTVLEPVHDGWLERTHLEVVADPICATVQFDMPAAARWVRRRASTRLGDGGGGRLGDVRWQTGRPALDGTSRDTLHLPELLGGDRVRIDVMRHLPAGPVRWEPGAARYWQAEVRGDARLTLEGGDAQRHPQRARWWTANAPAGLAAVVASHGPMPAPAEILPLATDVEIERTLTLSVPAGDPQVGLYPGGGSSVQVELLVSVPPGDAVRGWVVPAPRGVEVALRSTPPEVATLVDEVGPARVRVAPFEGTARVWVSWTEPDAPTFGEREPDEARLQVRVDDGTIAWEGDAWRLVDMRGRPILPDRARLVQALQARFGMRALPEPSVPGHLRGREPSWDLAADLRPALLDVVAIGTWPSDPLWPRRLLKARRSEAVTPIEAALIVVLWARQLGLEADWLLVRPAPMGPGPAQAPSGYSAPLVEIRHAGVRQLLDPTCGMCGPFELRVDDEGASALGPGSEATTPLTPGRLVQLRVGDQATWTLEGPPALQLRSWLATLPPDARTTALAERIGGAGALLLEVDGLADAGAPVRVVTVGGSGPPPLLPSAGDAEEAWLDWIGERRWEGPAGDRAAASRVAGPLAWSRRLDGDRMIETVVNSERRVPRAALAAIEAARAAPAAPAEGP